MSDINLVIPVNITLADIADTFRDALDSEQLAAFVLAIDEDKGDMAFTLDVRDRLNKALHDELAADNGVLDFLAWLVRLDDPANERGAEDRRTVTLSQIIGKARRLQDGAS